MNPSMSMLRFVLSVLSLTFVAVLGGIIIFYGHDLSQTQVVVLTMIATALVSEVKSATAYIFDGTPAKDGSEVQAAPAPVTVQAAPTAPAPLKAAA